MKIIPIDTKTITSWDSFHNIFATAFGFPDFYDRNMNAWNDCMTCLDDPPAGLSKIHVASGDYVCLQLEGMDDLARRCPDQYAAIIECSAFVNWRRLEKGLDPILMLSFPT